MPPLPHQGCLTAILRLFGIRLAAPPELPLYRLRKDFLSAAERSFYGVLRMAVADRWVIFGKVRLADIIFAPRQEKWQAQQNKIDRKHIDFLLCDPQTLQPVLAVELDDRSHARADRVERDAFVDRALASSGLPLLRVSAAASYDPAAIAQRIGQAIGHAPQAAPVPPQPVALGGVPMCPSCGVPMVARVAKRGANVGARFWGCPNYPRCKAMAK